MGLIIRVYRYRKSVSILEIHKSIGFTYCKEIFQSLRNIQIYDRLFHTYRERRRLFIILLEYL